MTFTTQILVVLPIGWNFPSSNRKHYQDLGSERQQYRISALVTQTSFCEGSSGDLVKNQLFSQAIKLPKVVLTFESVNHKLTSLQMKADDKQPFVALILCFCDHRNGARNSVWYLTDMKFVLHLLGVIRAVMIGLNSAKAHLRRLRTVLLFCRETVKLENVRVREKVAAKLTNMRRCPRTLYFCVATNFSTCLSCSP